MSSRIIPQFKGNKFKLPAKIKLISVRTVDGGKLKWRQEDRMLVLKDPCTTDLEVQYHKLEPNYVAAYYPLTPTTEARK